MEPIPDLFIKELINYIQEAISSKGYEVMNISELHQVLSTSDEKLIVKDKNGIEFAIDINLSIKFNKDKSKWQGTNYINSIKLDAIKIEK